MFTVLVLLLTSWSSQCLRVNTQNVGEWDDRHVIGGRLQPRVTSKSGCTSLCKDTSWCVAMDYNQVAGTCWFHGHGTACNNLHYLSGASHVRLIPCRRGPSRSSQDFRAHVGGNEILNLPDQPPLPPPPPPQQQKQPKHRSLRQSSLPTCGKPAISSSGGRILGGDEVRAHSWPWQVALKNKNSRSVRCAGSIIAPQWVLTTAHCVDEDLTANNWVVFAGAHDLMAFESSRSPYAVVSVILHQSFDINTFDNDIALLKLARPIRWSRYVRPVCLPPPNFEFKAGTRCNILGWGMAKNGRRPLKQASVPVVSPAKCKHTDWLGNEFLITDHMVCAGYEHGGIDSCQGDSGGPLLCYIKDRWVQAGITSFGRGCGLPQKPGVYAKVSKYIGWIKQQIQRH